MMKHKLQRWLLGSLLLALLFLLALVVCPSEDPAPVWTLRSDPYQIEILTPGGVFRQGNNVVQVRAWRGGQPVEIRHGRLGLSMLWMDPKPHMHAQAHLSQHASHSALEGRLHFNMDGIWNGRVQVETPTETVAGTFRIEVVE